TVGQNPVRTGRTLGDKVGVARGIQTFDCPAPIGVLADLEVIAAAPEGLNASGYADLVAKCPAGADWILADGLGIDPIDPDNWDMVQTRLRYWMADAAGVRARDLE